MPDEVEKHVTRVDVTQEGNFYCLSSVVFVTFFACVLHESICFRNINFRCWTNIKTTFRERCFNLFDNLVDCFALQ